MYTERELEAMYMGTESESRKRFQRNNSFRRRSMDRRQSLDRRQRSLSLEDPHLVGILLD